LRFFEKTFEWRAENAGAVPHVIRTDSLSFKDCLFFQFIFERKFGCCRSGIAKCDSFYPVADGYNIALTRTDFKGMFPGGTGKKA